MCNELKVIQSICNLLIDIAACIMKIGVSLSLPFAYIYYMCKALKNEKITKK